VENAVIVHCQADAGRVSRSKVVPESCEARRQQSKTSITVLVAMDGSRAS
jgi:hypothetical protein